MSDFASATSLETPEWSKPLPEQKVSNRSILRIQQLANELSEDLNSLPIFRSNNCGTIAKVLFAAIDPFHSYSASGEASRWYNFRLCNTYRFPIEVQRWLSYDRTRTTARFKPLFTAARLEDHTTRASFDRFIEDIFRSDSDFKIAFDQLLIALAVIPYRGVLLSLFEEAMGLASSNRLPKSWHAKQCCSFSGPLNNVTINPCDGFCKSDVSFVKEQGPFEIPSKIEESRSAFEILLPLTRGVIPSRAPNEYSPYPPDPRSTEYKEIKQSSTAVSTLSGFFVPAFDSYNSGSLASDCGQWTGGLAGWMVALFREGTIEFPKVTEEVRKYSWLTFTHLMQTFVNRVREANMFDLLEEYADSPNQPEPQKYFESHINHIIGWKRSSPGDNSRELTVYFDPPAESLKTFISPVSSDTRWNDDNTLPAGNERLCKQFLSGLRSLHMQRGEGRYDALDDISHEVKQVINALTGNWKLSPDQKLAHEITEYFDRRSYGLHPERVWLCPEPRLIESAARVIQLWTGSRAPLSFFGDDPQDLKSVFKGLWSVVVDSALGVLSRKYNFADPSDYVRFKERCEAMDRFYGFDQLFHFTEGAPGPFPTRKDSELVKKRWCLVFEVLLAKFKDIISHAHPERPRKISVVFEGNTLAVTIENRNRPIDIASLSDLRLRALCSALYDTYLFSTSGHGEKLLGRKVKDNPDFLQIHTERPLDTYKCDIKFFWKGNLNSHEN